MIHVPLFFGVVGRPLSFGTGHITIQCGGSLIGVPFVANGSVALQSVPPASMYAMPGFVFVGFALWAAQSAPHCIVAASAHIASSPTTAGWPGMHVHPLVPLRSTVMLPLASMSATVACAVIEAGPAESARAIFWSLVSVAAEAAATVGASAGGATAK